MAKQEVHGESVEFEVRESESNHSRNGAILSPNASLHNQRVSVRYNERLNFKGSNESRLAGMIQPLNKGP